MKLNQLLLMLLALMSASAIVSAQEASVDQLKQMMENSTMNLTTYTYARHAQTILLYSNASINKEFSVVKDIGGKVDLTNQSGYWISNLTDKTSGEVLTWDGYLLNGTEYWKEGQNWTEFAGDRDQLMADYNEIPGQVNLIKYSDMKIVGNESIQGEDSYKLVGSPMAPIYRGMIGLQLLVAYLPSPFPMPDELSRRSLNISTTGLMNNSSIVLTAWVSKDKALLKRLDINSSMVITPKVLNVSSPDYSIKSSINESTVYGDFGAPVNITLPEAAATAQNTSSHVEGIDWRWALFGSVRP
jgi:hypothetical protein